jgi:hypothetical protein
MQSSDDRYSFLRSFYPAPVCSDFTSHDFSIKSEHYDFANKPPYATCSSQDRLQGVKSQRKMQPFSCSSVGNFSSCPYYRSSLQVLKTSSFADKNIQLVKITFYDAETCDFSHKYIICSYQTNTVYMSYDSDLNQELNEKLFDDFVREAANTLSFTIDKVEPETEATKPKKVSYFSKLLSNLIPA